MWGRKPKTDPVEIPDDVTLARALRQQANDEHKQAASQAPAIKHLTGYLTERRALNHFGESIQITFTRRGHA